MRDKEKEDKLFSLWRKGYPIKRIAGMIGVSPLTVRKELIKAFGTSKEFAWVMNRDDVDYRLVWEFFFLFFVSYGKKGDKEKDKVIKFGKR